MDIVKIGKYIAGKRKELGMTQRQLAEKVGVSDKSVSKWERGVCLPDVSLYSGLCSVLGISINEFLAGEDIERENIAQKFEENIIGVATDSKHKQKRLKLLVCMLFAISLIAVLVIGGMLLRSYMPRNYISPIDKNSIEMKTAEMLSGVDGAFIYQYAATDDYNAIRLYVSEYYSGELVKKEDMELGIGSSDNGTILIVPDFNNFIVKVIIADEEAKLSTQIPILEDVPERQYYGRSATQITDKTSIKYNEEQGLVALVYDNDEMRIGCIQEYEQGIVSDINDYVYYFSVRFCK